MHKSELHVSRAQAELVLKQVSKKFVLKSKREIDHGIINLIYFLKNQYDTEYVLRICNPMWESYKVAKEKAVYDLVRERTTVPVPKVLLADMSKKVIPYTYWLWKKIEGRNGKKAHYKMSEKKRIALFREMGKYLAQIHSIKFRKFGDIKKKGSRYHIVKVGDLECSHRSKLGPFDNWHDLFKELSMMHVDGLVHTRFKRFKPQFEKFYKKYLRVLKHTIPAASFGVNRF